MNLLFLRKYIILTSLIRSNINLYMYNNLFNLQNCYGLMYPGVSQGPIVIPPSPGQTTTVTPSPGPTTVTPSQGPIVIPPSPGPTTTVTPPPSPPVKKNKAGHVQNVRNMGRRK